MNAFTPQGGRPVQGSKVETLFIVKLTKNSISFNQQNNAKINLKSALEFKQNSSQRFLV